MIWGGYLYRVLYGGRVSILIGVVVMLVRDFGTLLGMISGYLQLFDGVIMRTIGWFDGVSEYFAGDRDDGRAQFGAAGCLPGAGDLLHPGDQPA